MFMNILIYIFVAFEAVVGISSTLFIVVSLFTTLAQKIYRKVRFGASLYD